MLDISIDFSCPGCGRRLTARLEKHPPKIRWYDHGGPLRDGKCPTPGCDRNYSRLSPEEFKQNVFDGF